jgi:glycosyltransferase involved in cell wall biosynthesis
VISDPSFEGRARTPRVSVLVPVFNALPYLREALASVSSQTFTDFELLVIDDGSTDGSAELLRQYATTDSRIRVITRENKGLVATRNQLLSEAKAPLVAWMDSDDVSLPHRLESQIARFDADPDLICLGAFAQCVDPDGNPLNVEIYPLAHDNILVEQQRGGAMRFPTTMMRRAAALSIGGFRAPFKMGEDFDFLLRLSEVGKMGNLPDVLYLYRKHLASVCANLVFDWDSYRDQILSLAHERARRGRDRLDDGDVLTIPSVGNDRSHDVAASAYIEWSRFALMNRNRRLAWRYAKAAIGANPARFMVWANAARVAMAAAAVR